MEESLAHKMPPLYHDEPEIGTRGEGQETSGVTTTVKRAILRRQPGGQTVDIDSLPDLTGIIRTASHDQKLRAVASRHLAVLMAEENPLGRDHGSHHPRMSDMGDCSLRYVAANLGLLDLDRTDDSQWIVDTGTLVGVWFGCLLKAGAESIEKRIEVHLEVVVAYDGVPGHIDAYLGFVGADGGYLGAVPVEVKTTPSTSALKAPDVRKLPQCLQTAGYAGGIDAPYFGVVSAGYNIGDDKEGNPHPKMRHDWYVTKDYLPLVDEEFARLRALGSVTKADLTVDRMAELADNPNYCKGCRFSACALNRNPMRFSLV